MDQPRPIVYLFSFLSNNILQNKTVDLSGIQTRIIMVDAEARWPLDHHYGPQFTTL